MKLLSFNLLLSALRPRLCGSYLPSSCSLSQEHVSLSSRDSSLVVGIEEHHADVCKHIKQALASPPTCRRKWNPPLLQEPLRQQERGKCR
eukprot:761254-Hanusia_phi.AAC.4